MPASTVLSWWRGHPAGWWNPADYNVASICVPIGTHVPHAAGLAWGKKLRGEKACAIAYFGDGATSEGSFHEGANLAAVTGAPLVLLCNNNHWAISTPLEAQTRADSLGRQGRRLRDPGRARGRARRARGVRGDARGGRASAGGRRADLHRGRALPRRAARDRRRSEGVHRSRAGGGGAGATSAWGASRATCAEPGSSPTRWPSRSRPRPPARCARGSRPPRRSLPPTPALLFEHAFVDPPASFARDLAELRRVLGGSLG